MDDEYALCWNNFQETIATGFQNLYDRGDLVDVTLAVEGKLLHAHKIVLAICSPYFQEMFSSNPCKHPILILKDIGFGVMCELLQFMYQGAVSVKQAELPTFMKIAQTLQIRGLTTNSNHLAPSSQANTEKSNSSEKSPNITGSSTPTPKSEAIPESGSSNNNNSNISSQNQSVLNTSVSTSSSSSQPKVSPESSALKRINEFSTDSLSIYSKKQRFRNVEGGSTGSSTDDIQSEPIDQMHHDDVFIPPIPQISMIESRAAFDLNNVKREHSDQSNSPGPIRGCGPAQLPPSFPPFDYNAYTAAAAVAAVKQQIEYPNDLHMPNDYSKNNYNNHNHMDIPAIAPGERWFHGKLEFMLSQRGKPLLVHDGHTFGIQYVRKDKKYWQCNLSRKFNCKARVTTTETGEIIVTNNEHCHTEIRQHLRKDYQRNKVMMNALINQNQINIMQHAFGEEQFRRLISASSTLNFNSNNGININNNNFELKDLSLKASRTSEIEDSGSEDEDNKHQQINPSNLSQRLESP